MPYLNEIIPKIRGINILQNGGFPELVILVVEGKGARSEVDGYCTYVYAGEMVPGMVLYHYTWFL